jgi:hypothetical protein
MAFTDRNLVHADHLRARTAHTLELGFHILLVECLDRVPVQLQLRRHILDCCRPTAPADIMGKSLGIERVDVGNSIPIAFAVLRLTSECFFDSPPTAHPDLHISETRALSERRIRQGA